MGLRPDTRRRWKDASGSEVAKIQERKLSVRDKMKRSSSRSRYAWTRWRADSRPAAAAEPPISYRFRPTPPH
jgi:hypothetical protein